jgi:hypothetical protein
MEAGLLSPWIIPNALYGGLSKECHLAPYWAILDAARIKD